MEHAEEMLPVLAAPELYAFIGGDPPTLPQLEARYRQMVAGPPAGPSVGWLNWVLRQHADQHLVGTVQATIWADPVWPPDAAEPRASVAWVVGAAWQGRGLASEAAQALVAWLHGHGVANVTASIHPGNAASAAVARRAGLVPTRDQIDEEVVWVTPR